MLGDPERPFCPLCQRPTLTLIATVMGERSLDIYLCPDCRTQFSYEHPQAKGERSELKPFSDVASVTGAKGMS
jgi:uncharacterized protein YbaR (Trm112 family)